MPACLALGCSAFLRKALLRTCSANVPGALRQALGKLSVNLLPRNYVKMLTISRHCSRSAELMRASFCSRLIAMLIC